MIIEVMRHKPTLKVVLARAKYYARDFGRVTKAWGGKPRSPLEEKQRGRPLAHAEEDLGAWSNSHSLPALGSIKMDVKLNPDGDNSSLPTTSKNHTEF